MDAAAHYRHLAALGRDEFLAAAAPAALVRQRAEPAAYLEAGQTLTMELDELVDPGEASGPGEFGEIEPRPHPRDAADRLEVYPLAKKPGASFPDRITIGRTPNNDLVIADPSVSRLHAYVRQRSTGAWVVADAGSKNGSWLDDATLEPRREIGVRPGSVIRLGDVVLTFYPSEHLFDLLGGRS